MNLSTSALRRPPWSDLDAIGDLLDAAAAELDHLRAVDEFGMNRLVKAAADEWFDERAPDNVSMDDLNLLVHMITEKFRGDIA